MKTRRRAGRELILEDHRVAYMEFGNPLWFVLAFSTDGNTLDIIVVSGKDEEEARARVARNLIIRCTQLYTLLDRARIMSGFIKAVNEMD